MKLKPIYQRIRRKLLLTAAGCGVVLPVLGGCEPEVQTVLLGGVQDFANTLLSAFFLNIAADVVDTGTTVKAITEAAVSMLG